jgi:adenylate kinase
VTPSDPGAHASPSERPLVAVTGTPGVGKTTATERLDRPVVHLNDLVREAGLDSGIDPDRGSRVVDLGAARDRVAERTAVTDGPLVVESHVAHELDAARVAVLRCAPETIERRLRERGEPDATVRENAESEALDLLLSEAVARHGRDAVHEIDATDRTPAETAAAVEEVVTDDRPPAAGTVDFTDYLHRLPTDTPAPHDA